MSSAGNPPHAGEATGQSSSIPTSATSICRQPAKLLVDRQRAVVRNSSGRKPLKAGSNARRWHIAPRQQALLLKNAVEENNKERADELVKRRDAVARWRGLAGAPTRDITQVRGRVALLL